MCKNTNCGCIAAIIGAVLGIVGGILFYLGVISANIASIIIVLVIALIIFLLMILLLELRKQKNIGKCLCNNALGITITSALSILISLLLLSVSLVSGNIIIAILIGLKIPFFLAMLTLLVCWIICIIKTNCKCIRD